MPTPTTRIYFDHIVHCLNGILQCDSQGIIMLTDEQNTLACKLSHAQSDFCCHTFMCSVLPLPEEVHAHLLTLWHHRLEEEHLMCGACPPCLPPSSHLCRHRDSLSVLDMHNHPLAPILCPLQWVPLSHFLSFHESPHCLTFFPCPDHMVSSYLQLSIPTSDSASCPNMHNNFFFWVYHAVNQQVCQWQCHHRGMPQCALTSEKVERLMLEPLDLMTISRRLRASRTSRCLMRSQCDICTCTPSALMAQQCH